MNEQFRPETAKINMGWAEYIRYVQIRIAEAPNNYARIQLYKDGLVNIDTQFDTVEIDFNHLEPDYNECFEKALQMCGVEPSHFNHIIHGRGLGVYRMAQTMWEETYLDRLRFKWDDAITKLRTTGKISLEGKVHVDVPIDRLRHI